MTRSLSLFALAIVASVAVDHVSGATLRCGETYSGTYEGSGMLFTFTTPSTARTVVMHTCGTTAWDTRLGATGNSSGPYINDDMGAECISNPAASRIAWVSPSTNTYQVGIVDGLGFTYPGSGVPFSINVQCAPTVSLSGYASGIFATHAPLVDAAALSCIDDVWWLDAVPTCVGCGEYSDDCPSDFVHCAGDYRYGYTRYQAQAVAVAEANGGKHPGYSSCPAIIECQGGDFTCDNGNCIADPTQMCDCSNDCGDMSDEDPGYCGYSELFCNGPRLSGTLAAGDAAGYYFTVAGNRTVAHPRTCTPITDMDTQLELGDAHWNLIASNEDCGPVLCPPNELASGVAATVSPGTYHVCVKPGAAFSGSPNNYGVELICVPPLDNYWTEKATAAGLDPLLLQCLGAPDNVWEYNGRKTCVGCGRFKEPCDEEGDVRHCTGETVFGHGREQMEAVVLANEQDDGGYPGTTCHLCEEGQFTCNSQQCLEDTAQVCDCRKDCDDGSDEDPDLCGYRELTCGGPRLNDSIAAGAAHGYFFSIDGNDSIVAHPRTCTPVTDADTLIEVLDEDWTLIDTNEDCGPVLCPANPLSSGLSATVAPGTYHVCVKPGVAFSGSPTNYAVELRCAERLDDYWINKAQDAGLDPLLLACSRPDNIWEYDGVPTCVGCGLFKDLCDENGNEIHCAGETNFGHGSAQMQAVVTANGNGGFYPNTSCSLGPV